MVPSHPTPSSPAQPAAATLAPPHPSFREALAVWLRIGLLGFGGPAGQIALMHRLLVEERRWVGEQQFLHALNYCMLLPGPEAQQLAIYVGWLLHGTRGGVVAGTLFVLPGFAVILALSAAYALWQDTAWLESLFFGLKAAVLAIVLEALLRVGRRALRNRLHQALAALAFLALYALHVPFPLVVLAAGLLGLAASRWWPALLTDRPAAEPAGATSLAELVAAQAAARAGPSVGHALRVLALWGSLWLGPILALGLWLGWASIFPTLARFFAQMALVTFGGAYAALAYVAQAAVQTHGWLRPGEMLDGLALAETTPGPLILVLTYVGFLAAFRAPGGLEPLLAGVLGAALTTWVTFVPCFLWIFLGAPYVERLRHNRALAGALAAITAAVVGVILNLALWFGLHVLFRQVGVLVLGPVAAAWPVWRTLDPYAAGLAALAVLALCRWRLGMVWTLVLCALAGLLLKTLLPGGGAGSW